MTPEATRPDSRPLRIVLMGSPEFAVPSLELLMRLETVCAVVTQPDRPKGRGRALGPSPVKKVALRAGLPVLQPERVRANPAFLVELEALAPALIVVVAYGQILPPEILGLPRWGCINVHASLLPKYRGAAPIAWALIRGETETGITIMQMDEGMDTGPSLLRRSLVIAETDTAGTLTEKLGQLGAETLSDALVQLKSGTLRPAAQDEAQASYAPLLHKEQGHIDFGQPARMVAGLIRGLDPWPGATTSLGGQPLRLFRAKVLPGHGAPGTVVGFDREGLWVACREGLVAIGELQNPSRKRVAAQAFLAGHSIPIGTVLGS